MLNVQLLGGLSVFLDDRRLALELGASGRLLAGYLFEFSARPHRRERLMDFWHDLEPARARAALNTAIWRIRRTLALEPQSGGGCNLISRRGEIVLEPAHWLSIDTHTFDKSLGSAPRAAVLDPDQTARLEYAVGAYAGPFLDGDEGDWVVEERERLHSLYVRALGDLVRSYALKGEYEKAITAAKRILCVDKFRESVQRQLMLLLFMNDQRVDAIRHFVRWRDTLQEELNIKPMPQTLALAELMRSGDLVESAKAWMAGEFSTGSSKPVIDP